MEPTVDQRYRNSHRSRSRSRSRSPSPSSSSKYPRGRTSRTYDRDRAPSNRQPESGYYYPEPPRQQQHSRRYDDLPYSRTTYSDPMEEHQRRMKMAKLRAENEAEERRFTDIQDATTTTGSKSYPEDQMTSQRAKESILEIQEGDLEEYDEEEQMQMLLGFNSGFASTKGKAVEDNQNSASRGAAAKNKARKYRQYMNRKGGFNRPLDPMK